MWSYRMHIALVKASCNRCSLTLPFSSVTGRRGLIALVASRTFQLYGKQLLLLTSTILHIWHPILLCLTCCTIPSHLVLACTVNVDGHKLLLGG